MSLSRNARSSTIKSGGQKFYPSSKSGRLIHRAVKRGFLNVQSFVLAEGERLDVVSANFYGDASYWWVIAAASGIGWQCQVPPGTMLKIPTQISKVIELVG